MGRTVLYWWPDDGRQRGTVARLCARGAFSNVVAYTRRALRGTADTLLDAGDISRFFPRIDLIFFGEALNPFFGAQDEGFLEFRPR